LKKLVYELDFLTHKLIFISFLNFSLIFNRKKRNDAK
jgi:hypothetical protein